MEHWEMNTSMVCFDDLEIQSALKHSGNTDCEREHDINSERF